MLCALLDNHGQDLVRRVASDVVKHREAAAARGDARRDVPMFVDAAAVSPGEAGTGPVLGLEAGAARYARELLRHGYGIDEVVRGFADLRRSIRSISRQSDEPLIRGELDILDDRLDQAIEFAVVAYSQQHAVTVAAQSKVACDERLAALAGEMRNLVNTAVLAVCAIKRGRVGLGGATGGALDRSLAGLRGLVERSLAQVRQDGGGELLIETIEIGPFIAAAQVIASTDAANHRCDLTVVAEPDIFAIADRHLLDGALSSLVHGVLDTMQPEGHLFLSAGSSGSRITIELENTGASLQDSELGDILARFEQRAVARTHLGSALLCSAQAIEAGGGSLRARSIPGRGCLYTIDLPAGLPAMDPDRTAGNVC